MHEGRQLRPIMVNQIASSALLVSSFCGLMAGLLACQRHCRPHPELMRKLVHLGMGLVALSLPWLFESAWSVVVLTSVFVLLLIGLRVQPTLRIHLGSPIHGVDRKSLGDIYFALGVGGLFLFSSGDPLLFCIPILILTLADAAAGVTGLYYGRLRYVVVTGEKSIEGSIAFFFTAFLSAHTALLLFTEIGRIETLLIALALGLFLTLVEAVASNGLDNLLIPLAALLLLKAYLGMDLIALAVHLGTAILITSFALFWVRRRLTGRLGPRSPDLTPAKGHLST
jgi:phytol kinase